MEMYFNQPAKEWEETFPIGNGHLGGMVFGSLLEEKIGLNDENLWSGYPYDKNNPRGKDVLEEIRERIFQGENQKAEDLATHQFTGNYTESFLPLGDLYIKSGTPTKIISNYRRQLFLKDSLVKVSYEENGKTYQREYFASNPDKGIYGRYESEEETSYTLFFQSQLKNTLQKTNKALEITVKAPEHVGPAYLKDDVCPIVQGTRGQTHDYLWQILETDGKVLIKDNQLIVKNCHFFTFSFQRKQDQNNTTYQQAKESHLKDYHTLFNRVALSFGEEKNLPMDERLKNLQKGNKDPNLYALYFQYGRYLLISSSRKGGLPANLQGLWSWELQAPWSSNYTTNINLQMNYWSADSLNLEECFEPYERFIKRLTEAGKKTARDHYGMRGSVCHHNTDKWLTTNPVGRRYQGKIGDDNTSLWSMWNMALCWMASDLYRHYTYTKDELFLKETVLPVLKENVLFLLDYLVEINGTYHTAPSSSPENKFYNEKGEVASLTYSSTMDLCLVQENFLFYLKTCERVKIVPIEKAKIENILRHLAPIQIGSKGQVLEWQKEYEEVEPGHRHVSHLYGLFPGNLYKSPKMKKASLTSLQLRMANGGGYTGWSNAWVANLFAKLGEKDLLETRLQAALKKAVYPNLWSKHPPFQIDGNLGIGQAIVEAIVAVDEKGNLQFLKSLPDELGKKGYAKGLKIPGNKTADVYWENGKVIKSRIY